MLRATIVALLLTGLLASAVWADVYKYTDERGKVVYTDRPIQNAERLNIRVERATSEEREERLDEEAKSLAENDQARQDAAKEQSEKKKANESSASQKAELCNKAREDYYNRMNARRLYEEQSDGERRLLEDKEIDAARDQAKRAMDALCN